MFFENIHVAVAAALPQILNETKSNDFLHNEADRSKSQSKRLGRSIFIRMDTFRQVV